MSAVKEHGRIYTPNYLVQVILDFAGYKSEPHILDKHIIDNSCGDGAFLVEIVKRYCTTFSQQSKDKGLLKKNLEAFVHGIELDKEECEKCINNLDKQAESFGVKGVKWDVLNADTLTVDVFNGKMDYVVGNPPYVRVHNLDDSYDAVKRFSFSQGGMTDLFIVFFEIGFRMMSPKGTMCLITPSSWLTSVAGGVLRRYAVNRQCLNGVIDLAHFQPFNATTYTLISRYSWNKTDEVEYNVFDEESLCGKFVCNIPLCEMQIGDGFFLADKKSLENLREIRTMSYPQVVRVKNGFATLSDDVFIGDWSFSGLTIDVIKSSTGKWHKCIFPYDEHSKPIPFEVIEKEYPDVYSYFKANETKLRKDDKKEKKQAEPIQGSLFGDSQTAKPKRKGENNAWYLFGRSQAINDVRNDKISVNSVIKDVDSLKISFVPKGKGVYGGLYILTSIDIGIIKSLLCSEEYVAYIAMLKNYKSGGYYTCSGKDIELYLNYKLSKYEQH